MRTHGVVDPLPLLQFAVKTVHLQRTGWDLIELLGVVVLSALDGVVELGGSKKRCRPRCWRACSSSAANSVPPSTCTMGIREGMRFRVFGEIGYCCTCGW